MSYLDKLKSLFPGFPKNTVINRCGKTNNVQEVDNLANNFFAEEISWPKWIREKKLMICSRDTVSSHFYDIWVVIDSIVNRFLFEVWKDFVAFLFANNKRFERWQRNDQKAIIQERFYWKNWPS